MKEKMWAIKIASRQILALTILVKNVMEKDTIDTAIIMEKYVSIAVPMIWAGGYYKNTTAKTMENGVAKEDVEQNGKQNNDLPRKDRAWGGEDE